MCQECRVQLKVPLLLDCSSVYSRMPITCKKSGPSALIKLMKKGHGRAPKPHFFRDRK